MALRRTPATLATRASAVANLPEPWKAAPVRIATLLLFPCLLAAAAACDRVTEVDHPFYLTYVEDSREVALFRCPHGPDGGCAINGLPGPRVAAGAPGSVEPLVDGTAASAEHAADCGSVQPGGWLRRRVYREEQRGHGDAYVNHNLIEATILGAAAHVQVEGTWNDNLMNQISPPGPIQA